jgi:hypothetical protein
MSRRSHGGDYPPDWDLLADETKKAAGYHCIQCGYPSIKRHILTVHHLDMNPANNAWWNRAPLCQVCHLSVQARIDVRQSWMFEPPNWIKLYLAGRYAFLQGLPDDRDYVTEHLEELLGFGVHKF